MMRVLLAVLVVTAVQVYATRRTPPFTLDGLVTCGQDADDEKPSIVPTIPLVPTDLDKFWLPQDIDVDAPRGLINYQLVESEYVKRYGVSFNSSLTAIVVPPGEDGVIAYKLSRPVTSPVLLPPGFNDSQGAAAAFALANGLGMCDNQILFEWVRLPDYYFPSYALMGRCPSTTQACAFPPDAGYQCAPDRQDTQIVDLLRWDCCYALVDNWWMRRCGWRHVQVPTIIHCACTCSDVNPGTVNFAV